uniref:(northern house mosquito) hypothetical protein n=1 Tax=Culex pipiens TaxID=7175 RepID=A0A8D8K557_CULPI
MYSIFTLLNDGLTFSFTTVIFPFFTLLCITYYLKFRTLSCAQLLYFDYCFWVASLRYIGYSFYFFSSILNWIYKLPVQYFHKYTAHNRWLSKKWRTKFDEDS